MQTQLNRNSVYYGIFETSIFVYYPNGTGLATSCLTILPKLTLRPSPPLPSPRSQMTNREYRLSDDLTPTVGCGAAAVVGLLQQVDLIHLLKAVVKACLF